MPAPGERDGIFGGAVLGSVEERVDKRIDRLEDKVFKRLDQFAVDVHKRLDRFDEAVDERIRLVEEKAKAEVEAAKALVLAEAKAAIVKANSVDARADAIEKKQAREGLATKALGAIATLLTGILGVLHMPESVTAMVNALFQRAP